MREGGRLAPPRYGQLVQDVRDVMTGRLLGDEQMCGDLAVGHALGQQLQHVHLAIAEAESSGRRTRARHRIAVGSTTVPVHIQPSALDQPGQSDRG